MANQIIIGRASLKGLNLTRVIACAAGCSANTEVLKQIANIVVRFDKNNENIIKAFFKMDFD